MAVRTNYNFRNDGTDYTQISKDKNSYYVKELYSFNDTIVGAFVYNKYKDKTELMDIVELDKISKRCSIPESNRILLYNDRVKMIITGLYGIRYFSLYGDDMSNFVSDIPIKDLNEVQPNIANMLIKAHDRKFKRKKFNFLYKESLGFVNLEIPDKCITSIMTDYSGNIIGARRKNKDEFDLISLKELYNLSKSGVNYVSKMGDVERLYVELTNGVISLYRKDKQGNKDNINLNSEVLRRRLYPLNIVERVLKSYEEYTGRKLDEKYKGDLLVKYY